MAKRKSHGRDVITSIANPRLPHEFINPIRPLPRINPYPPIDLEREFVKSLEDRRAYRPDRSVRQPASMRRQDAYLVASAKNLQRVNFYNPRFVALCVRRKVRKEVLHAIQKTGKNGGRKYRRNFWSDVGC